MATPVLACRVMNMPLVIKRLDSTFNHLIKKQQIVVDPPNLNDAHLNSYSIPSEPLEIVPQLTMDYSLDNPFDFPQRSVFQLVPWCAWPLSGALKILRLRLRRLVYNLQED